MASFVEQATLKINDQSSKQIKAINSALKELQRTSKSLKSAKFSVAGLTQAQRQISQLNKSLNHATRNRTVTITQNVVQRAMAGNNSSTAPAGTRGGGGRGRNTFGFLRDIAITTATITVARATITAVTDLQSEQTRQNIMLSDEQRGLANEVTRRGLEKSERVSFTRGMEISRDSITGGLRGAVAEAVIPEIIKLEGEAGLLLQEEQARSTTKFTNKLLNLANATDDATRSIDLARGAFKGAALAGESFSADTALAAIRTSGLAPTIDEQGLINFMLIADAMGQQAGSATQRFIKEMTVPLNQAGAGGGISKGAVENLIGLGVRGEKGLTAEQNKMLLNDPVGFVLKYVKPALEQRGVDTSDPAAVRKAATEAGFAQNSGRFVAQALSSEAELQKQREQAARFNEAENAARRDLGAALTNLTASLNTAVSTGLEPFAASLAPATNEAARMIEKFALNSTELEKAGVALGTAASAFIAFKGGQSIVNSLFSPLNGSAVALNGSAAALTQAAIALGGAGVAGGKGGKGAAGAAAGGGLMAGAAALFSRAFAGAAILSFIAPYLQELKNENYKNLTKGENTTQFDLLTGNRNISQFDLMMQQSAQDFATTFQNNKAALDASLGVGGEALGSGIMGALDAGGNALAAKISAAISNANVTLRTQAGANQPSPNTGAMNPTE